mmetsp:Transcript_25143/g.52572  ORF Transcript_25143/g.52572 Transcript_25143/m.52572 type:complete len:83 (-) Transcript_25143:608-856(-)|eukprot:CAMPEP_0196221072 /NCGR_PEP_ID=MMETSP0912-20130531/42041_1 /TAXON_ID=49265 /ORGANISM="Thalassiosira rotula, Strain GSO102" /LENGTH=82 /DNA_ID=CAMNT_0041499477 /DNA_START=139 /DNA_END=387 /DNA_ORIENTATION=-
MATVSFPPPNARYCNPFFTEGPQQSDDIVALSEMEKSNSQLSGDDERESYIAKLDLPPTMAKREPSSFHEDETTKLRSAALL